MVVEQTESRRWAYVGVGCLTAVIGWFGGAMIAVFIGKIVGAIQGCAPDAETGAPCGWFTYAVCGALVGLVAVPGVAIWRMRVGERRDLASRNSETG
jgi:hypothetical protein